MLPGESRPSTDVVIDQEERKRHPHAEGMSVSILILACPRY